MYAIRKHRVRLKGCLFQRLFDSVSPGHQVHGGSNVGGIPSFRSPPEGEGDGIYSAQAGFDNECKMIPYVRGVRGDTEGPECAYQATDKGTRAHG